MRVCLPKTGRIVKSGIRVRKPHWIRINAFAGINSNHLWSSLQHCQSNTEYRQGERAKRDGQSLGKVHKIFLPVFHKKSCLQSVPLVFCKKKPPRCFMYAGIAENNGTVLQVQGRRHLCMPYLLQQLPTRSQERAAPGSWKNASATKVCGVAVQKDTSGQDARIILHLDRPFRIVLWTLGKD